MPKKLSIFGFIQRSKDIHNNKYDYSLVNYINNRTKVKIICKEHGIFEQTPREHIRGNGCKKCRFNYRKIDSNFIEKSKKIHGDKYDYSLVEYKGNKIKVKIICKEHGIFEQIPNNHTSKKVGCPLCSINEKKEKYKIKNNILIKKLSKVHNNKYDYSLIDYKNNKTKIKIICKKHGLFEQRPDIHIRGIGCAKCSNILLNNKFKKNKIDFLKDCYHIHGHKYDYSLVNYINNRTKIKIICKKHGVFDQNPYKHINGHGCQICNESKGEKEIRNLLNEYNVSFESQKKFNNCKYKYKLPFDFYLPLHNICIEYDGIQHFKPIKYFGGEESFKLMKIKDKIKTEYCNKNNIELIRIKYIDNIKEKLNKLIKKQ